MSKVRAEQYTNRLGTGAPEIPYGVTVPEGASIDGAGGLNLTGIATAGTFKGNLTGDVSGNVTGVAATFTGPVTIGGTLTYEDVTNIDSVGVITARDGIKVTGGDVQVGSAVTVDTSGINVTGVVTATSYRGDGSQLSGIEAAPTIQLVADGSISAEEAVVAKGGKVAAVTEFTDGIGARQTVVGSSGVSYSGGYLSTRPASMSLDSSTNRVLALYKNNSSTQPAYIVGTVSDSANSVTWGTASDFSVSGAGSLTGSCSI